MADTSALYKRAEEAFQKNNFDYAKEMFKQILALDPDHAQARKALYATIVKKFQHQGATGKIALMAKRGQFEVQLKTTKDAGKKIQFCHDFLDVDPQNSKARTTLADLLLGLNHFNGAAAEAEMALAAEPTSSAAAKILVSAYIQLGKLKEAQGLLEKVASLVSSDRDLEKLQRDLAARQTMKKGFEDATGKEGYRSALKDSGKAAELEKDHKILQNEADIQALITKLEEEHHNDPTDARIPKKIGDVIFDKRKDWKAAAEWYKKASQLAPQDSVLRDKVDDCQLKLLDAAVEAAQKTGDPAKIKEARANKLRAQIQSFERRVGDRPTDMGLRFELGRAYLGAGPSFVDKSIAEFQQSVRDPKRKSQSHLYLGMAFQVKKLFDMADKQYQLSEEGVLDQNQKLTILYNRAKCNAEGGKLPAAIDLGKRIMEIDISYKDISALVDQWGAAAK
jgi:tetratricopeptide (TPR) repeat protein